MEKTGRDDEPQRGRSPLEDEISAWADRARELGEQAKEAGFTVAFVIVGHDPLTDGDWRAQGFSGSFYAALGALQLYVRDLKEGDD